MAGVLERDERIRGSEEIDLFTTRSVTVTFGTSTSAHELQAQGESTFLGPCGP